jgi:hypothetical protein
MAHFPGTVMANEALYARPYPHVYLRVALGQPLALPEPRASHR